MNISVLRDWVIVLWGLTGIIATLAFMILSIIMSIILYRRAQDLMKTVKKVLASLEATSVRIEQVSSYAAEQVAKPLIQTAAIIQGMLHGLKTIGRIFRKGENDGKQR